MLSFSLSNNIKRNIATQNIPLEQWYLIFIIYIKIKISVTGFGAIRNNQVLSSPN
ncbi:hypothetical protein LguiA_033823 [Lonicera macranthoides]